MDHSSLEAKSPPPDSPLQSDSSIDSDKLLQILTQDFQTLVLSSNDAQPFHQHHSYPLATQDEDQIKQPPDDELVDKVTVNVNEAFEPESLYGAEEKILEEEDDDHKECRVLEERESEVADDEIGGYESENVGGSSVSVVEDGKGYHYPLRPDAEDCSYYMRTGMCKYGSTCKFNHPLRRKHQQTSKETHKQKEENMEMHGQIECKYYLSPAGCKYGKSCKFSHGRGKTVTTPVVEYNFLGLPIRPGEKECPYYMRNGSCKYGPNCRFNHPDPSAVVAVDAPTAYGNDAPLPLQPPPQPNIPSMPTWSGSRTPDPTGSFVPVMYPPTQNMPPPNPDWNGYQAPPPVPAHVYLNSERGLPIPPAFYLNNPPSDTNMYARPQQPMVVSEYPERPGQPDCSYFMKTGDCKYRASCKFHHPRSRITRTTPSVLSDKGLPLRPDQNICTYYSRYGICKYGPACKYDHPVNYTMNSIRAEGYDGSDRSGPLIQQSV
ncbi:zinc finger CCCH domain-containing protein 67 isoform X1 [Helianthus annuus]|uniref:zinc finger CCCH domain-containing protein 67 isoform X1 n=1 Tax=Helianthus annuus TaxID=4232 RepID=UPI000B8F9A24|nr:zinc finger CCCH domain-containing protein 67 isoform X1 [Helianthus annuus]